MKTRFTLIVALGIIVSACGSKKEKEEGIPATETIPVKVEAIHAMNGKQEISVSGQFYTDDETYLSFLSGGIIQQLLVKEGDRIRKGQVLAKLDVTSIKSTVNQAKIALEKAKRDLERTKNLQKDGFATLEQLQNAQTGVDLAEQQLQSAQFNLRYSEIRAVSDGFVLKKMANQGQLVGAGAPVFQTNGAGTKAFKLKVGVSDQQWSKIEINDKAMVESDIFGGKKLAGKVVRKSESIDPLSGTFTVEIEILDKLPTGLASGVFGKATIAVKQANKNWMIPYAALLDGNANEGFVFVTNDKTSVQKVPVTISNLYQDEVEVSGGLEGFKYVIVSGSAYLNETSSISIR